MVSFGYSTLRWTPILSSRRTGRSASSAAVTAVAPRIYSSTLVRCAKLKALAVSLAPGDELAVYVPHPFNPLANFAFFLPATGSRHIYQDGLLNYYDAPSPLGNRRTRLKQRLKAAAIGVPFRPYRGHLSGIDSAPVASGFFTHPDKIVCPEKFQSLHRLQMHASTSGPRPPLLGTLFLDQPIESLVAGNKANELRSRTIDYVKRLGGPVFYKPHYNQRDASAPDPEWGSARCQTTRHACRDAGAGIGSQLGGQLLQLGPGQYCARAA